MEKRGRRHRIDIYYDILSAIQTEVIAVGGAKPTRIHHVCNVSYDKHLRYLEELEQKKLIAKKDAFVLTEKGYAFLKQYNEMKNLHERMGLE